MRKFKKYFLLIWVVFTLLVYASVFISPLMFPYSPIISLGIPLLIFLNSVAFVGSIILASKKWWLYLGLLLVAIPFVNVMIQFNQQKSSHEDLKILSYNVKWFFDARQNNYQDAIDWLVSQQADIVCLQEFYPLKNISKRIIDNGAYYNATFKKRYNVAIYSKYPIVDKGLLFPDSEFNNVLYADVQKGDEIFRIYSVHLQSMGIKPEKIQDREGIQTEYEDVKIRLIQGAKERAEQIRILLDHADKSPYPVIIAGDFNDTPYSFNYFKINQLYDNAFEEKGKGFGTTYNGAIPFLRIDHQFFSNGFEATGFETLNKVNYSDHFPIIGYYRFKD